MRPLDIINVSCKKRIHKVLTVVSRWWHMAHEKGRSSINYRDFRDLSLCIKKNIHKVPKCDLIVGIPRSGMIPAYMIGIFLNKKVCSIDEFLLGINPSTGSTREVDEVKVNDVLVVDDTIHSGGSIEKVKEKVATMGLDNKYDLKYLAIYAKDESKEKVDSFFEIIPSPRLFQWNYLNVGRSNRMCFDIDGVLCVGPTKEEKDDGEKYKEFLLNAKSLYIPKSNIYALVTNRLEKYRLETEEWLRKNDVKYDILFMLDLPSKEDRIRLGMHAKFKAEIYSELKDSFLFVESDDRQAKKISELSGKPCVCVETDTMYEPDEFRMTEERSEVTQRSMLKGFTLAFHNLWELADRGDMAAMSRLAHLYYEGRGVDRNVDMAIEWMRKSSNAGGSRTKNELIAMLLKRASNEDIKEVYDIRTILAEEGDRNAAFRLARMYRDGEGAEKNIEKAIEFMRQASDKKVRWAKNELIDMLMKYDVDGNCEEAYRICSESAKEGDIGAMRRLSRMYYNGKGVEKNIEKAIELMSKIVENNVVYRKELENMLTELSKKN